MILLTRAAPVGGSSGIAATGCGDGDVALAAAVAAAGCVWSWLVAASGAETLLPSFAATLAVSSSSIATGLVKRSMVCVRPKAPLLTRKARPVGICIVVNIPA